MNIETAAADVSVVVGDAATDSVERRRNTGVALVGVAAAVVDVADGRQIDDMCQTFVSRYLKEVLHERLKKRSEVRVRRCFVSTYFGFIM